MFRTAMVTESGLRSTKTISVRLFSSLGRRRTAREEKKKKILTLHFLCFHDAKNTFAHHDTSMTQLGLLVAVTNNNQLTLAARGRWKR